jgi:hypothetical protein
MMSGEWRVARQAGGDHHVNGDDDLDDGDEETFEDLT